jgi:hypothetical protein
MSNLQEIDVTIRPDGSVEVRVRGVHGKECLTVTKKLEQYLGGQIESREHTDEMDLAVDEQSDDLTVGES